MLPAKARHRTGAFVLALRPLAATALAAAAILAAGCGDEEPSTAPDEPTSAEGTDLTLTLDPDGLGGEEPMVEDVNCDREERHADCAVVGRLAPADLAPVDPGTACTEIFGGPDEVRLEGALQGEPVDVTLTRANGCEIERFDRVTPLLEALFPGYRPGAALAP